MARIVIFVMSVLIGFTGCGGSGDAGSAIKLSQVSDEIVVMQKSLVDKDKVIEDLKKEISGLKEGAVKMQGERDKIEKVYELANQLFEVMSKREKDLANYHYDAMFQLMGFALDIQGALDEGFTIKDMEGVRKVYKNHVETMQTIHEIMAVNGDLILARHDGSDERIYAKWALRSGDDVARKGVFVDGRIQDGIAALYDIIVGYRKVLETLGVYLGDAQIELYKSSEYYKGK